MLRPPVPFLLQMGPPLDGIPEHYQQLAESNPGMLQAMIQHETAQESGRAQVASDALQAIEAGQRATETGHREAGAARAQFYSEQAASRARVEQMAVASASASAYVLSFAAITVPIIYVCVFSFLCFLLLQQESWSPHQLHSCPAFSSRFELDHQSVLSRLLSQSQLRIREANALQGHPGGH